MSVYEKKLKGMTPDELLSEYDSIQDSIYYQENTHRYGKSGTGSRTAKHYEDHPRSRGEYRMEWRKNVGQLGSSPLARGIY